MNARRYSYGKGDRPIVQKPVRRKYDRGNGTAGIARQLKKNVAKRHVEGFSRLKRVLRSEHDDSYLYPRRPDYALRSKIPYIFSSSKVGFSGDFRYRDGGSKEMILSIREVSMRATDAGVGR